MTWSATPPGGCGTRPNLTNPPSATGSGRSKTDPWGTEYELYTEEGRIDIRSAGPDREFDTRSFLNGRWRESLRDAIAWYESEGLLQPAKSK